MFNSIIIALIVSESHSRLFEVSIAKIEETGTWCWDSEVDKEDLNDEIRPQEAKFKSYWWLILTILSLRVNYDWILPLIKFKFIR